jgi:hypothetical protein
LLPRIWLFKVWFWWLEVRRWTGFILRFSATPSRTWQQSGTFCLCDREWEYLHSRKYTPINGWFHLYLLMLPSAVLGVEYTS